MRSNVVDSNVVDPYPVPLRMMCKHCGKMTTWEAGEPHDWICKHCGRKS